MPDDPLPNSISRGAVSILFRQPARGLFGSIRRRPLGEF